MRILAFADTHGELDFSHLEEFAEQADLIVCAGDISFFGGDLEETFFALEDFAKKIKKPVLFIPGNHEQGEDIPESEHIINIDQDTYHHDDVVVVGFGGGGFRKNDKAVEAFFSEVAPKHQDKKQVWLFHGPPHNLKVDEIPGVGPTGCESKRKMIDTHKPVLVVAAHIHEQWGTVHKHDDIVIVNPGPFGRLLDI